VQPCHSSALTNSRTPIPLHRGPSHLPLPFPSPVSLAAVTARHVWSAVSPPSALRHAICSGSARRCASCQQAACSPQLFCHLESHVFRTYGPGVEVCAAIDVPGAVLKPLQTSWTAHYTATMERRADTQLRSVHPQDQSGLLLT
jgi:hypothetical protein